MLQVGRYCGTAEGCIHVLLGDDAELLSGSLPLNPRVIEHRPYAVHLFILQIS